MIDVEIGIRDALLKKRNIKHPVKVNNNVTRQPWVIPMWLKFVLPVMGLYASYMVSNVFQEELYDYRTSVIHTEIGDRFESASLFTFIKSSVCVLISWIAIYFFGDKGESLELFGSSVTVSAMIKCIASISTLYSLNFITYPQAMLGKCVKIIPIILFEFVFDRKIPSINRCMSVTIVTIGMILFSYSNMPKIDTENTEVKVVEDDNGNDLIGWALIALSLILDGALAISQKRMISSNPGISNTMLVTNLWQMVLSGVLVVYNWREKGGILFIISNGYVVKLLTACSIVETLGQFFVFSLLLVHGPLVTAITTTTRKFFTILVSIFLFGHTLSFMQWSGVCIVFSGIFIDIFAKKSPKILKDHKEYDGKFILLSGTESASSSTSTLPIDSS